MSAGDPDPVETELRRLRHDIRTPLAVIVGFADLIGRRDELDADQRREFASRIAGAADEIRRLLESPA